MDIGPNLFQELETSDLPLTETLAGEIVRQILSFLVYFHSKGFVYNNFSPESIYLDSEDSGINPNLNIKITDIDIQCAIQCSEIEFSQIFRPLG